MHGRGAAYALAGLAALHVPAALKHQWADRDGLLQRMLPGRTAVTLGAKPKGGKLELKISTALDAQKP